MKIREVQMRKLDSFIFMTLDGYYEGPKKGDISWHTHGKEENEYAGESLKSEGILLFGRITYDMMVSYWPTPMAAQNDPAVALGMNKMEKIVFSRTLKKAEWNNTTLINGNIIEEIKKLKQSHGKNMTILGSGSIVSQFAEAGLIDEFQIMVDPVILGAGTQIFKGLKQKLNLKLESSRTFKSGVVLLNYRPLNLPV
jgi:dihydrofolate reductase